MRSSISFNAVANKFLPLADNFLVFIILAANSSPVAFCTHLRTMENAPLKINRRIWQMWKLFLIPKMKEQNQSDTGKQTT